MVDGMPVTTVARTIADLAAARIDGGHLASVVRDALTVKQVSDRKLSAALRPFAYRYGAPAGDGEALLARLVQESGVAEPLGRAVELSRAGELTTQVAKLLADTPEMARLQEQMASIQRVIGPALMSPALERSVGQISAAAAKNMAQSASTAKAVKGVQDAVASTNLVEMSRLAEKIRQMVDTPEFRRFMAQQRKAQQ